MTDQTTDPGPCPDCGGPRYYQGIPGHGVNSICNRCGRRGANDHLPTVVIRPTPYYGPARETDPQPPPRVSHGTCACGAPVIRTTSPVFVHSDQDYWTTQTTTVYDRSDVEARDQEIARLEATVSEAVIVADMIAAFYTLPTDPFVNKYGYGWSTKRVGDLARTFLINAGEQSKRAANVLIAIRRWHDPNDVFDQDDFALVAADYFASLGI